MRSSSFTFTADDGHPLFVLRFLPDEGVEQKAVVHVAHGMAEHAARYSRTAEALTSAGYVVYAGDHRGHGQTARTPGELGFFAEADGFSRVVRDLVQLIELERSEQPGLPVVLFGHSMGSFLTQAFLIEHGAAVQGAVLSGSAGKPSPLAVAGKLIARVERLRLGAQGKSALLDKLGFGRFNDAFRPNRTAFDWLSRDPAEVDRYVADPLCGFTCSTQLWIDLLDGLTDIARPKRQARIPKDLPIYVFSGSEDPVGDRGRSVRQLLASYEQAGLRQVRHRLYDGGRHEMVNETNRDEVLRDLTAWLDGVVAKA